jgi:hypothetical protein
MNLPPYSNKWGSPKNDIGIPANFLLRFSYVFILLVLICVFLHNIQDSSFPIT